MSTQEEEKSPALAGYDKSDQLQKIKKMLARIESEIESVSIHKDISDKNLREIFSKVKSTMDKLEYINRENYRTL